LNIHLHCLVLGGVYRCHADGAPAAGTAGPAGQTEAGSGMPDGLKDAFFGSTGPRGGRREGLAEAAAKSALRSMGTTVGREIIRGVLGSLLGGGAGSSKRRR
jgi:hypothetical protein